MLTGIRADTAPASSTIATSWVVLRPVDPTTPLSAPQDPLSSANLRRDPDALMWNGPVNNDGAVL
jgi:hypothetical protein